MRFACMLTELAVVAVAWLHGARSGSGDHVKLQGSIVSCRYVSCEHTCEEGEFNT